MPEEDFDTTAFDTQWEAEQNEEPEEHEFEEGSDEQEEDNQVEEQDLEDEPEEDPTPDNAVEVTEEQKRNTAFAQLRRERDEAAQKASFLERLADENGMTVDEIIQRYEESALEEEAENQNIPVEVLQRLKHLEEENDQIKYQNFSQRFNNEVDSTMKKYNASQDEIEKTFAYAQDNGLTDLLKSGTTSFESVHRLAHLDSMIETQVSKALQDNLSKKKKRQQDAPLSHGSGADFTVDSLEDRAVSDAKEIMANW